MGKRYHCDYCDKTMVASPAIVKTHNKGLIHQKLVNQHYQLYKDPETILAEESVKKPCLRFASGTCNFDGICRFSHYSQEQLLALRQQVAARKAGNAEITQPSFQELYQKFQQEKTDKLLNSDDDTTTICDSYGMTYIFPWTYNHDYLDETLPPSLKRMKIEDFENAEVTEWG